ncbi:beta-lactamase family protein [Rossellomorea marisflavi]|uniref:serine hydrolase domain-containing protein n=1 Tax=Rossellomorea marisflavi TaxID=189381 RepID=UPI0020419207|nr:serine hydrolase domain-containing protein [Rossellomorea marisflavi]MCM2605664.1 beta-lactamase family protein [Rossellomorea marisflavi]
MKTILTKLMNSYHVPGMGIAYVDNNNASIISLGLAKVEEKGVVQDTLFHACSISKFVTAMFIVKLCDKGLLSLDHPVENYLCSWSLQENGNGPVTLRHLLSHQGGIEDPEGSFGIHPGRPDMAQILNGETLACPARIEAVKPPNQEFIYSDAGYCIVQQVVEDVLDIPFETAIEEHLFRPLGMKRSMYEPTFPMTSGHEPGGSVMKDRIPHYPYAASAGLWSTPSDLMKLVKELFRSLNGEGILFSKEYAMDMISPQGAASWAGLGVFVDGEGNSKEISSLGWGEGFQSMMVAEPLEGKAWIIMTNGNTGIHQMKGLIGDVYRLLTT